MKIGILTIEIFMYNNHNLKEKRTILNSLKKRLRNNFNISLIEADDYEKWQKATLVIVAAGKDNASVDSCFSGIIDFLDRDDQVQLVRHRTEII